MPVSSDSRPDANADHTRTATFASRREADDRPKARPGWPAGVALLAVLIATAGMFARICDLGLLGYDTYPIILSSRVQSWSDAWGNFREALMDGRYVGRFYRPVLNWSFALDYAWSGVEPRGYHLSDALLYGACAAALFVLARRLTGPGARLGPLLTLGFFLLHPGHLEVVPVPARRADLLCGLFLTLAVALSLPRAPQVTLRRGVCAALFSLLAMGSKETGFVAPLLVFAGVCLRPPGARSASEPRASARAESPDHRDRPRRVRQALRATAPHAIAAAVMLAARLAVLGGLGGHPAGAEQGLAGLGARIATLTRLLICPQPLMECTSLPIWLAGAAAVVLVVVGLLSAERRRPSKLPDNEAGRALRVVMFGATWIVVVSGALLAAGRVEPWYLFPTLHGLALMVGMGLAALVTVLRRGGVTMRVPAAVGSAALVGLAGWQVRYSPLVHHYDEYDRATQAGAEFLDVLRARLEAAPPGTVIPAPPVPRWVRPKTAQPTVRGAAILTGRSVQAWAELLFPHRRVRVAAGLPRAAGASADEVVVLLRALRPGFEGPRP